MNNNYFNLHRFYSLLRQDFSVNYQKILLVAEAVWGILVVALLYLNTIDRQFDLHNAFFPFVLVILGLFFASISFGELSDKNKSSFYLTLPASLFEKFLSRLLFSTIGYLIIITLVFYSASLCSYGIDISLFNHKQILFNAVEPSIITAVSIFLIFQSVFFFGSVYFRELAFFKMVLLLSGLILLIFFLISIEFKIILWNYVEYFPGNFNMYGHHFLKGILGLKREWTLSYASKGVITSPIKSLSDVLGSIFKSGVISVFFLFLSYLRLKETEV